MSWIRFTLQGSLARKETTKTRSAGPSGLETTPTPPHALRAGLQAFGTKWRASPIAGKANCGDCHCYFPSCKGYACFTDKMPLKTFILSHPHT